MQTITKVRIMYVTQFDLKYPSKMTDANNRNNLSLHVIE